MLSYRTILHPIFKFQRETPNFSVTAEYSSRRIRRICRTHRLGTPVFLISFTKPASQNRLRTYTAVPDSSASVNADDVRRNSCMRNDATRDLHQSLESQSSCATHERPTLPIGPLCPPDGVRPLSCASLSHSLFLSLYRLQYIEYANKLSCLTHTMQSDDL